jgi:hypothetical protein
MHCNNYNDWCKIYGITPTEYDNESLSYYQVLCKVLSRLTELEKIFTCETSEKVLEILDSVLGNATYDKENNKIIFSYEINVTSCLHNYNLENEEIKIESEEKKHGCIKVFTE